MPLPKDQSPEHVARIVAAQEALIGLQLSAESLASIYEEGISSISKLREVFHAKFKGIVESFTQVETETVNLKLPDSKTARIAIDCVTHMGYTSVRKMDVTSPQGLSVPYITVLKALNSAASHACDLNSKVLAPYTHFLAVLLNTRNSSAPHIKTFDFAKINDGRAQAKAALDACYNEGFEVSNQFGNLFANANEFKLAVNDMETVNHNFSTVNHAAVVRAIKPIKQYLRDIYNEIEAGRLENLDSDSIRCLSDGAFAVASEIEFVSISYFRAMGVFGCMTDTIARIAERYPSK